MSWVKAVFQGILPITFSKKSDDPVYYELYGGILPVPIIVPVHSTDELVQFVRTIVYEWRLIRSPELLLRLEQHGDLCFGARKNPLDVLPTWCRARLISEEELESKKIWDLDYEGEELHLWYDIFCDDTPEARESVARTILGKRAVGKNIVEEFLDGDYTVGIEGDDDMRKVYFFRSSPDEVYAFWDSPTKYIWKYIVEKIRNPN